eukprot:m.136636 g.136636  ORF g.136636 m.136636 type:complete len:331 (+) comp29868_c2_seq1:104-1096(+)
MSRDNEHRERLFKLQQQYESMQTQYDERIADLESQVLSAKADKLSSPRHRPYTRVKELEMELMNLSAAHKTYVMKLEKQLGIKTSSRSGNPLTRSQHTRDDDGDDDDGRGRGVDSETETSLRLQLEQEIAHSRQKITETLEANEQKVEIVTAERDEAVTALQALRESSVFAQASSQSMSLQNKVESLERVIRHLNEKLSRSPTVDVVAKYDTQLRERDRQLDTLHAQLTLAKKHHSPSLLHFDQIEARVIDLEARLRRRDREVEALTTEGRVATERELSIMEKKWRGIVASKQAQVETFRLELDKLLEAIRIMQRQGVRVTFPTHISNFG